MMHFFRQLTALALAAALLLSGCSRTGRPLWPAGSLFSVRDHSASGSLQRSHHAPPESSSSSSGVRRTALLGLPQAG